MSSDSSISRMDLSASLRPPCGRSPHSPFAVPERAGALVPGKAVFVCGTSMPWALAKDAGIAHGLTGGRCAQSSTTDVPKASQWRVSAPLVWLT